MMEPSLEGPSQDYRVYGLSPDGRILENAYFQAENDALAIAWARRWSPETNRELWQGRRKVLVIEAGAEEVSPGQIA